MTDALATRRLNGSAAELAAADSFQLLDTYAGGVSDTAPRPDALATISAGEKVTTDKGKQIPQASRDGRIVLHDDQGRAPGLKAALERTGYKRLTIAFPWNDPNDFFQQRFVRYSASRLEVYGDQHELQEVIKLSDDPRDTRAEHRVHPAGSTRYAELLVTCKVECSVYFGLAEWVAGGAQFVFDDGVDAYYRLRFMSRNSQRRFANTIQRWRERTNGRIAGIPFDLSIDYLDAAGPDGVRRKVPVWSLAVRPPQTVRLTSLNYEPVIQAALAQGAALMLPPPRPETYEMAQIEAAESDLDEQAIAVPTDEEIGRLQAGGDCDAEYWKRRWGAIVDGTSFDEADARAEFIGEFTRGRFHSLKKFLEVATEGDAEALIAELQHAVDAERAGRGATAEPIEAEYVEVDEDAPDEEERPDAAPSRGEADQAAAEQAGQDDPLGISAEQAVLALRRMAAESAAKFTGAASPAELTGVRGFLAEFKVPPDDQETLVRAAFGKERVDQLQRSEARALLLWASDAPKARQQLQHIVMFYGGQFQRSLV